MFVFQNHRFCARTFSLIVTQRSCDFFNRSTEPVNKPFSCARFRFAILATLLCATGNLPVRAAATFTPLGDLPGGEFRSRANGISDDGSVVIGRSESANRGEAFRWTAGDGMKSLLVGGIVGRPTVSTATDISGDGSVVVGVRSTANGGEAYRWSETGGAIGLGSVPGGTGSNATAISADGSVVVGLGSTDDGPEAFRWTTDGGMVGLGDLPGGVFNSIAAGVSANGLVVVGSATPFFDEAFRWNAAEGIVGLGDLPGSGFASGANDVSDDGTVIVGYGSPDDFPEAFRWTATGGMVGLGRLPDADSSIASAVSADGSVVVGQSAGEAFYWTQALGMVSVRDLLMEQGAANLASWRLEAASAISSDGSAIAGWGINPNGETEAWVAGLGRKHIDGDTNADGSIDLADLNNVRNNFGGEGLGDTNGDNDVDLDDLNAVRNNFGVSGGAMPVPEPTSLALLVASAAGLMVLQRKLASD